MATGVAVLAVCSIFGFALYVCDTSLLLSERLPWPFLIFTTPGVVLGGRYGAKFERWIEERAARRHLQDDAQAADVGTGHSALQ